MRKKHKEQLLELLCTLEEAQADLNNRTQNEINNILADCQEGAIVIGNMVEQEEGNVAGIVSSLERYCELLFRLSVNIKNESVFKQTEREAAILLKKIKQEVETDIPLTYEIVFLPYKASMWDSLESIWLAAKEDKNCRCHVIPIPYFEKGKDGAIGDMQYEGNQFPLYVPLTDYDTYNFSESRPDIIYFHNPFDQYNFVTSVHPNFYSSEIKRYTDMLVYVPYYITNGTVPETHMEVPGYVYADKIILQNEQMKEELSKKVPEKKLVILGSPKIDRMIYMENHKAQMPEAWRNIIADKKVFFYNTSITRTLADTEKELKKMEEIFSVFQKQREVILIWRPHPLMSSTLQSLRPQLLAEYHKLEQRFVREKIGILDTTADVNATIANCDAYMGEDTSSLVQLFGVTGKPIFILANKIFLKSAIEKMYPANIWQFIRDGEEIWFVSGNHCAICKMNLKSGTIEVVAVVPEIRKGEYSHLIKYKNKIILLPYLENCLCEYDLETKQFRKNYFNPITKKRKFFSFFTQSKFLYLVPGEYPAIVKYDMEQGNFIYYDDCIKELCSFENNSDKKTALEWSLASKDNVFYTSSLNSNTIISFDMDNDSFRFQKLGEENDRYICALCGAKYMWLLKNGGAAICRWNPEDNSLLAYNHFPQNYISGSISSFLLFEESEWLCVFPYKSNMAIKLHMETGKMIQWDLKEKLYTWVDRKSDGEYIAHSLSDNSIIKINSNNGETEKLNCKFEEEDVKNFIYSSMNKQFESKNYLFYSEDGDHSIDMYIEHVKRGEHDKEMQLSAYNGIAENMDGSSGKKIHEYIMKQMQLTEK